MSWFVSSCIAISLVACRSHGSTSDPTPANREIAAPAPQVEKRCLPVIAKECGCTYACGSGVRDGDHWRVTHAFWKGIDLTAQIEAPCIAGTCTPVFAAEIVCTGVCAPKAPDRTCHFDPAGACVGATP